MIRKGNRVLVPWLSKVNPFGVRIKKKGKTVLAEVDPTRSKLAAGVAKGFVSLPSNGEIVAYLGASAGYTVSFLAQQAGLVLAVELSPIMTRELILNTAEMNNVAPICASAASPADFAHRMCLADYLFQDISQRDQLRIFRMNVERFLSDGGIAVLAIKARSIDATKDPDDIFKSALAELASWATVIESVRLDPLEKDHLLVAVSRSD